MPQKDLPPPIRDPLVGTDRKATPQWQQWFDREPTVQIEDAAVPQGTPRDGTVRAAPDGSFIYVRIGGAWFKAALVPA
jgi:hypothetical protein